MSRFTRTLAWFVAARGLEPRLAAALVLGLASSVAWSAYPGIGRPATPAEIAAWDIDVRADFKGLPPGSGSVEKGQGIWDAKCAECHGTFGESNEIFQPIVGGTTAEDMKAGHAKALATGGEARTTLMKLATISTLWDYVRRAMPWNAPKTLSTDDVYAVVAYILNLGDIVPAGFVLSDKNIAEVQQRLPNRNGLARFDGLADIRGVPDVKNVACMKDCPVEGRITSSLPESADGSHGDLQAQVRPIGPTRGRTPGNAPPVKQAAASVIEDLVARNHCMSCHTLDQKLIGPAFREVAARYKGDAAAEGRLAGKIRRGGSGAWGSTPMPSHPQMTQAEATALARWVLSSGL